MKLKKQFKDFYDEICIHEESEDLKEKRGYTPLLKLAQAFCRIPFDGLSENWSMSYRSCVPVVGALKYRLSLRYSQHSVKKFTCVCSFE